MPRASISDRIRWDNVARLGAVLAVVAVVALWPRLQDEPVAVPEGRPRPVVSAPRVPAPAATARVRAPGNGPRVARTRKAPVRVGKRRAKRRARVEPPARPKRRARVAEPDGEAPEQPAPPPPAPSPAPPSPSAVTAAEFGVGRP